MLTSQKLKIVVLTYLEISIGWYWRFLYFRIH